MALRVASGFGGNDFTYISKMSVPAGGGGTKKLQPPIGASPGELRLWRMQNGLLNDAERRADALEHTKAKSRRVGHQAPRPDSGSRVDPAQGGPATAVRHPRPSLSRQAFTNVAGNNGPRAPSAGARRHSCVVLPSLRAANPYRASLGAGARTREVAGAPDEKRSGQRRGAPPPPSEQPPEPIKEGAAEDASQA